MSVGATRNIDSGSYAYPAPNSTVASYTGTRVKAASNFDVSDFRMHPKG